MGHEWRLHKWEMISALENVEVKLDQRLTKLEKQFGAVNKHLVQLANRIQKTEEE